MKEQRSSDKTRTSRRTVLAAGGALGAAALSGCGGGFGNSTPPGMEPSTSEGFEIPDASKGFPTGEATFRMIDSDDTKKPYWRAMIAAYAKKFPDLSIKYDGLPWNRIEEIVPLGFRNGSSHDLIQLPGSIPLTQAVSEGWVAPVDDYMPDFEAWKATVPETVRVEGIHVFDGKQYSVVIAADQRYNYAIHYGKKLLNDAGYDPEQEPFTWDSFREAAKKVTKQNNGKAYGLILELNQPGRISGIIESLARIIGLRAVGNILQPSGEFFHDSDEIVEAIGLLQAIKADGSLFPGSNSLTAPECWPRVARGNAAMVSAGPWVTVQYETENPDFDFGVAALPRQDSKPLPLSYSPFGADSFTMAKTSKVKAVAGHVLQYVTSLNGQTRWGEIVGVGNPPLLADARKLSAAHYSDHAKACQALAETMRGGPSPQVANPDVALVTKREKPVSPDFGDVIQAILVGKTTNVRGALKDLKDRSERTRDAAIAEAKKRDGSTATREDWVFPNWDPTKDYAMSDYKQR